MSADPREQLRSTAEHGSLDDVCRALQEFFDAAGRRVASTEFAWRQAYQAAQRLNVPATKLVLASSFTVEPVVPHLGLALLFAGRRLEYHTVAYTRWFAALSEKSDIDAFEPDHVLLLLHAEDVVPKLSLQHLAEQEHLDEERAFFIESVDSAIRAFRQRSDATVFVNTLTFMQRGLERYFDWNSPRGRQQILDDTNRELSHWVSKIPNARLYDYAGLVTDFGRQRWYDRRGDAMRRTAIATDALPVLAGDLARFLRAVDGSRKKGLVVDLDNTFWGGIVGEAGPDGIQIGGDYPGNAFQHFHATLRNLRASGVLLAIASKNNDSDVAEAFERRGDDILLKPSDFSARQIHWGEKPNSIKAVAEELNIGSDSLVFVDDSPIECELVETFTPEVETIRMDGDPSGFSEKVLSSGFFDIVALTAEDRQRADFYRSEVSRRELAEGLDKDSFLASLAIKLDIRSPSDQELERVTQLINKTNQFNLTTKRYTRSDLLRILGSPEHDLFVGTLSDRFGSYGLIGACIIEQAGDYCTIDTFLMSCRVLGRGAEDALLAHLEQRARARGAVRLNGRYSATKKNLMVKDFYPDRGFDRVNEEEFFRDLASSPPMRYPKFLSIQTTE